MRISTNQIFQRAITNMLTQQAKAAKLQEQLATGRRVEISSDDPIAASQIELMNLRINTTELLQKNRLAAESSLNLEEVILSDTVSSLHRLREIQVQAGNTALSEDDRKSLGKEAITILNQLQDYANSKDGNGNFMFSGGQSSTQTVSVDSTGKYIYNGDATQRFQVISGSMSVAINDTADSIFMRIPNGNGTFAITQSATPNTGTAYVSTGSVVNKSAYTPDNYTMSFATNTQGQLVVMVSGTTSGNVIPPSGLVDDAPVYQEGSAISFNGMEMTVNGTPQAGDSFLINPAQNESVFSTAQRLITNLNKPFSSATDKAATQTENNQILAQLDSALTSVLNAQSEVGSRLNQLESADKLNNAVIDSSKEARKALQEIDPVDVATQYNLQLINLQAAQQSFVRIQSLSVFNYI